MRPLSLRSRGLALGAVLASLVALFVFVALRFGPLAPVAVTVATVESRPLAPMLFGIGTVEPRRVFRIGPTAPGRLLRLLVDVGDSVVAGQLMGEMDPVDLDARVRALQAALNRSEAVLRESEERLRLASAQADRYQQLLAARSTSDEISVAKTHDKLMAEAAAAGAREEVARAVAELDALRAQRQNLRLVSPVSGVIASRDVDPGTTVVAGEAVVEVVDPGSVWVNVRFDQSNAQGLRPGQPAQIELRSRAGQRLTGRVVRVEPRADAVTEELLVKVAFDALPDPFPSLGELAEVSVQLPSLSAGPIIPNAAVQRISGQTGVWRLVDGGPRFTLVTLGAADLDGRVQVRQGLDVGSRIVVHSARALSARSRVQVVDAIPGVAR